MLEMSSHEIDEPDALSRLPPLPPKRAGRRRILSCDTCRRAKTRCDLNPNTTSCNRCQKLRTKCSLESGNCVTDRPRGVINDESFSLEERVATVEESLLEMKGTLERICTFMQDLNERSQGTPRIRSQKHSAVSDFQETAGRSENIEFPHLLPLHSESTRSAPIMMVRKFRSKARRLYKDGVSDIIDKGVLGEDMANLLVSEFVRRQGRVIQIERISAFTSGTSLRHRSPLLFAVCCLHGLRFCNDLTLVNPSTHRLLYEEVRDMLGQVVLASPLPIEELYAILIMCTFEAAPKPVFEYIESWLLSGICAKQAMLSIDFAQIVRNIETGKLDIIDKQHMSFWNNTCLINLRFAVGTGKPPTIPADYIKQCPAILNHPDATVEDGIVLAEILLFSALYYKLGDVPLLDQDGRCEELTAWETKWKHLLTSPKAIMLGFSHDIAYLMLAQRSLAGTGVENTGQSAIKGKPRNQKGASRFRMGEEADQESGITSVFQALARRSAHSVALKFLQSPISVVQELPKFHHICIAYCALVLSDHPESTEMSGEELLSLLKHLREHYARFSGEIPPAMNFAVERVKCSTKEKQATSERNEDSCHSNVPISNSESPILGPPTGVEPGPQGSASGTDFNADNFVRTNITGNGIEHVMEIDDFRYGSEELGSLPALGSFFNGEFISFVDYFNNNI